MSKGRLAIVSVLLISMTGLVVGNINSNKEKLNLPINYNMIYAFAESPTSGSNGDNANNGGNNNGGSTNPYQSTPSPPPDTSTPTTGNSSPTPPPSDNGASLPYIGNPSPPPCTNDNPNLKPKCIVPPDNLAAPSGGTTPGTTPAEPAAGGSTSGDTGTTSTQSTPNSLGTQASQQIPQGDTTTTTTPSSPNSNQCDPTTDLSCSGNNNSVKQTDNLGSNPSSGDDNGNGNGITSTPTITSEGSATSGSNTGDGSSTSCDPVIDAKCSSKVGSTTQAGSSGGGSTTIEPSQASTPTISDGTVHADVATTGGLGHCDPNLSDTGCEVDKGGGGGTGCLNDPLCGVRGGTDTCSHESLSNPLCLPSPNGTPIPTGYTPPKGCLIVNGKLQTGCHSSPPPGCTVDEFGTVSLGCHHIPGTLKYNICKALPNLQQCKAPPVDCTKTPTDPKCSNPPPVDCTKTPTDSRCVPLNCIHPNDPRCPKTKCPDGSVVPFGTKCHTNTGGKGGSGGGGSSHTIAHHGDAGGVAMHKVASGHPLSGSPNTVGYKSLAEAASEKGMDIGETLVWLGGIYHGINVENPPNALPPPYLGK